MGFRVLGEEVPGARSANKNDLAFICEVVLNVGNRAHPKINTRRL